MTFGTGQAGHGPLVVFIPGAGQKFGPTTPTRTGQRTFVADEQDAVAVELIAVFHGVRARWLQAAFVPGEFDGGLISARPELIGVEACGRGDVFIYRTDSRRLDAQWLTQIQGPHRRVKVVAEKIPNWRGSEVPEVPPPNRIERGAVTAWLTRPEPQIPIHSIGSWLILRASREAGVPASRAGPGMDFTHVTDGPVPDDFAGLADEITRVALIPHLGRHAGFVGDPGHLA